MTALNLIVALSCLGVAVLHTFSRYGTPWIAALNYFFAGLNLLVAVNR